MSRKLFLTALFIVALICLFMPGFDRASYTLVGFAFGLIVAGWGR